MAEYSILCVLTTLLLHFFSQNTAGNITSLQQAVYDNDSDSELLDNYVEEAARTVENDDNNGEGSSTSVHVRKIGKKKGEKLKRKEQMRQYHEVRDDQLHG